MNRPTALLVALSFLIVTLGPLAAPAAGATPTAAPTMKFGMDIGAITPMTDAGVKPDYAMYWVGAWMTKHGWGGFDNAMKTFHAAGVTPVIHWYYWGDHITPSCVENGCNGKSKAEWYRLAHELANRTRSHMGGAEVIISLETEFNKGGVDAMPYATTFDTYLKEHHDILKAVPGVKTVAGFGAWNQHNYKNFPKTIGAVDLLGFQQMRASTRDAESTYRSVPDLIASTSNHLYTTFGKQTLLYDLALSSYPEPGWVETQNATLKAIFDRIPELQAKGLTGIVYRELRDNPGMGDWNYFGVAEQHWGFRRTDGTLKPAYATWMDGIRAHRANGATPPPPPPAPAHVEAAVSLPAASVEQGESLTGTLTVKNSGGTAITLRSLAFAARPPGGTNAGGPYLDFGSARSVSLAPGETKTFTYTKAFTTSDPVGEWWTYAAVQFPDGRWEDQGPVVRFTVKAPASPARVEATVTASPATVVRGDEGGVGVSLRLENTGGKPASLSRVVVNVNPAGDLRAELGRLEDVTLAPGEVRLLHLTKVLDASAPTGDWLARAALTHANGTQQESPRAFFVVEAPPAIVRGSVATDRAAVMQGESLAFTVRLENAGREGWTVPRAVLHIGPEGGALREVAAWTDLRAASGATATGTASWGFVIGDATGPWVTRLTYQHPDGREEVVSGPTFRVDAAPGRLESGAALAGTTVTQGESLNGTVTVRNSGGSPLALKGIVLAARPPGGTNAGGPYLDFGGVGAVTLQPGETRTFSFTRAFKASEPTGDWYAYAAVQLADGTWRDSNPNQAFKVVAPAPKPIQWAMEAEAFPVKSTGGRYSDTAASGGAGWNVWSNGHLGATVDATTTGSHTFSIVAKGTVAANVWPTMVLQVDGKNVATWQVSGGKYATYTYTGPLTAGAHTVRVLFTNDAIVNGQDRNLLVDRVALRAV